MLAPVAAAIAVALATPTPDLHKQVTVAAPPDAVWSAWTTSAGAKTFFAPDANIRLEVGGAYELYFAPRAPAGQRGSDGMRVLAWVPREVLAFEWNAPPTIAEIREGAHRSFVVVQLAPAGEGNTHVTLHHGGFGEGGRWGEVRAYFDSAWDHVLKNLVTRFEKGPIDWTAQAKRKQ